ncbi:MAG: ATP-binding protein [Anaerolineae bacterium]|nr:ATP-binding protein [Anaerolineae bacterium]
MAIAEEILAQRRNLIQLQTDSLHVLAIGAGVVGYLWLILVVWPITGATVPFAAWVGSLLLVLASALSYALRNRHPRRAAGGLVWASLFAVVCALVSYPRPELAYLLTLPVIFASVLLAQGTVFLVAGVGCALVVAIGLGWFRLPLLSLTMLLPVTVIAAITVASWLSARSLFTALAWVWNGYERAHRNERIAREGQAELRRALKALDEATYRLERANYMLSVARDQAEEARRLKQQFAQTISHELRTPLNLIVSFTDLMAQAPEYYGAPLPASYARDLGIVHRNACHLQSLVNDVLDLARIEAAQMTILQEATDPRELVDEAVRAARSLVEVRGLELRVEVERDLPPLWVDAGRIRQVLFNLLANAARFTERGSVAVSVRRRGEEVLFSVADTGIGIAAEDLPHIFEEFRQLDGGTRRRHGGAGLGLAISRQFVELHGGRIWVESQPGQGSTFHFSLPIARHDPLADARGGQPRARQAIARPHDGESILLAVTRSPAAASLLARYVRGCRTVVAQDLQQAQRLARQLLPQGVIVDLTSESIDIGALQELAQTWGLGRTPMLACPLPGEEPLRQRLAVDGYLVKPVSRQGLWDVLRQFGEDVDRVLVVDDDRDFVRLMGRLLQSPLRRYQVVNAYSGHEALEMIQHHQPDLVLLDMVLPDVNGAQVIERIRADPARRHLPIVVVSAQDEIDAIEALPGAVLIARASGILPGEVVRLVQHVLDEAACRPSAIGDPRPGSEAA